MPHEVIFWSGSPGLAPADVWERLYAGRPVSFIDELGAARVRAAFRAEFGDAVKFEEAMIYGPGFELEARNGARYLEVCCSAAPEPELVARLERAACERLGCAAFEPRTGRYREARAAPPPPPSSSELASSLAAGTRVHHAKFGAGEIVTADGDKLTVRFGDGQERRLLRRFVESTG
jgi:hypothetical protein